MDKNMLIYLIVSVIVGFILGLLFVYLVSPKTRKYNQVKKELETSLEELNTQRQMMVKHFSHSAEILDSMAKEFRRLYQHMAENSSQFISHEEMPALNSDSGNRKKEISLETQPVDYPDNPSGLLKNEEIKS